MRLRNHWKRRRCEANYPVLPVGLVMVRALALGTLLGVSVCRADEPARVSNRNSPNTTAAGTQSQVKEHPLIPFLKQARVSRDAIAAVKDYEARFTKRELVGRTMYTGQMVMKLRQNPFSVYLRFVDSNAGREVMFAGPRYKNMMMAHEPAGSLKSIVGTVALEPQSPRAMAEGRHPINKIGMLSMVEALVRQWEAETKYGETNTEFYPNAKLTGPSGDTECEVLESTHPQPRRQFTYHRSRLYIDKKTRFPVRIEQWGFPANSGGEPYLIEEYTYTDIRPNVGLTDADFDIHNRNYRF